MDTFKWTLADQGTAAKPARDIITDFGTTDGERDVLDLADLLKHPGHDPANLSNYLDFKLVGQDTVIDVKPAKGDVTQQIVLQNVDLTHDANHAQLSDTQILKNLLDHGQLHTD
ncbi:type I secretion C-terminal target domain-containing protein [Chromobacterium sp. IIBBL 290-4]|nr:type I secretion C-terminal target domain-containing protein [Chromobacterium sp. IIBBL 290-4]